MGIPILIMGASGSGKSASLRNFTPNEVGIFNVARKPLPFKNKLDVLTSGADYKVILDKLVENKFKTYVVDDAQYLMAFEQIAKARESGYLKYTEMALHFTNLISTAINKTSDDTLIFFLQHTERTEDGFIKAKTVGKLIDNWITLEGLFSIVLLTDVKRDGKHVFITQSDGYTTAKSPMDMFPYEIDNDLKLVENTVREYYGMESRGRK